MPNQQTSVLDHAGIEVADTTIRHLVEASRFPMDRLVAIVRDVARRRVVATGEAWAIAGALGDAAHPLIEARSGPAFTSEELARLLGVTSETVRNFLKRERLIAYPALTGKGSRFPKWQFEPQGKSLAVLPWVEPLLASYGHNGWGVVDFLTVPREDAKGLSYLALLQQGEKGLQAVLSAAKRSNPN
ncbi:hypothetical protein [Nibricoccus sp. IMCC34717]|uniref:hypothetical protein n=1 Tax=Nibricoccus sp. IMCC34717 TaxID=3034021 RepID=UPI00384CD368